MSLVARNLVYRYAAGDAPVLDGLSLSVTPGSVVALCGAARSGRSTLLSLMAGLSSPQAGEVMIDEVAATAHEARGRVGLLLQNADEALFGLTVRDDVMFAPLQLGATTEDAAVRAERALQTAGLHSATFARRSPFSLSGGQRRRVAIAGLLAMEPSYVLLDEPFVGLDPQGRDEIAAVVHAIVTSGFTKPTGVLVAVSTLEAALQLADHLAILHNGRIVWEGAVTTYGEAPPDVEQWGLHQPDLVALAALLRERGWEIPPTGIDPMPLARAISARVKGGRS